MRKLIGAGIVVAAGAAISVGVVFGSDSSTTLIRASQATNVQPIALHQVSEAHAAKAAKVRHGFRYFESAPFTLGMNNDSAGFVGKCPRRWKAINGYFGSDNQRVVAIENFVGSPTRPNNLRKWTIAVRNEAQFVTANAFVGVVCGRV